MSHFDEGVIKYDRSHFSLTPPIPDQEYRPLERWRKMLFDRNLIGEYEDIGFGYGNASERRKFTNFDGDLHFLITGTQTGKLSNLNGAHYTRVIGFELETLKVVAAGPLEASSETMTHASIYEENPGIKAIFHIHNSKIWKGMLKDKYPQTSRWIPYGTVEMALAVKDLVKENSQGAFVMAGHEDGVITFGPTLSAAGKECEKLYHKYVREDFAWD